MHYLYIYICFISATITLRLLISIECVCVDTFSSCIEFARVRNVDNKHTTILRFSILSLFQNSKRIYFNYEQFSLLFCISPSSAKRSKKYRVSLFFFYWDACVVNRIHTVFLLFMHTTKYLSSYFRHSNEHKMDRWTETERESTLYTLIPRGWANSKLWLACI